MAGLIERRPDAAQERRYDILVIGGGVHGICLTLEAARRGLATLLIDRFDFAGDTSWNSLRIVHGGLRYLQSLDLPRFFTSVGERRRLLREYPDLVSPLPCLMPLYQRGLRRRSIMRAALIVNDSLSWRRNHGVDTAGARLPRSRLLDRRSTTRLFPAVDTHRLAGSALWYDAVMVQPQRLMIEMLRWARHAGADALNYVAADELLTANGRVRGVAAHDVCTGAALRFEARAVVNCAGPSAPQLAERFDRNAPPLVRPSLAFNLFLARPPFSEVCVAVTPPGPNAQTYFAHPLQGGVLAGTYHGPWRLARDGDGPSEDAIEQFLGQLRAALPGVDLQPRHVAHVLWGLLPGAGDEGHRLATRQRIHDHGAHGGPCGLISVSGVKLTTARRVAEDALEATCRAAGLPWRRQVFDIAPPPAIPVSALELTRLLDRPVDPTHLVRRLITEEAVVQRSDLLRRRTDWWLHERAGEAQALAEIAELPTAVSTGATGPDRE